MRGGKREGAGRKPAPPTTMYFIRVPITLAEKLKAAGPVAVRKKLEEVDC